jgi:urea transport system permease protein
MVCWVAVGGRGTLWGAVVGAILVNWTRVTVSSARPDDWQYFQGLLFVVVLAFAPGGVAGTLRAWARWVANAIPWKHSPPTVEPVLEAAA